MFEEELADPQYTELERTLLRKGQVLAVEASDDFVSAVALPSLIVLVLSGVTLVGAPLWPFVEVRLRDVRVRRRRVLEGELIEPVEPAEERERPQEAPEIIEGEPMGPAQRDPPDEEDKDSP